MWCRPMCSRTSASAPHFEHRANLQLSRAAGSSAPDGGAGAGTGGAEGPGVCGPSRLTRNDPEHSGHRTIFPTVAPRGTSTSALRHSGQVTRRRPSGVVRTSEVNVRGRSDSGSGSSGSVGASGDGAATGSGAGGGVPSVATNSVPHAEQRTGSHPPADGNTAPVRQTGHDAERAPSAVGAIRASRCAPCAVRTCGAGGAEGRVGWSRWPPMPRKPSGHGAAGS
jgi:hypothetical protein